MKRVKVLGQHLLEARGVASAADLSKEKDELEKRLREVNAQLNTSKGKQGPLAGVKILDVCQAITGPFGAMMLGDMGADVIKVESPSGPGDMNRAVGPATGGEYAAYFHNHNRGKRCISIDMRKPEGLAAFKELAKSADVLIQNMRPGVATKLGFGYDEMKKVNENLIYLSISGYGQTGPYKNRPAFDAVLQCMTGFATMQGQDGPPQLMNTFICDKVTSYTATQAILAALHARATGKCKGQNVEISMLDASLMFFWLESMAFSGAAYVGDPPTTGMNKTRRAPQKIRKTKDGWAAMQIWPEASHWNLTLKAFGLDQDWLQDAESPEGLKKVRAGYGKFQDLLDAQFAKLSNAEVDAIFDKHQLPGATVVDITELHLHPQAIHMKSIVEHEVGKMGPIREPRPAPLMSETPCRVGGAAPNRGQHTDEVLKEVGYSAEQIKAMRAGGVFGKF
jgi:crotonobetainyl-CoA:carnitine CoA-transferase CaiB-like acyl-CoA transferase